MRLVQSVVFRVDASIAMGTGHVMRCLTLADVLRDRGMQCVFVTRLHQGHLVSLIRERGHGVEELPKPRAVSIAQVRCEPDLLAHAAWLGCGWMEDCAESEEILSRLKPDAVVVDHYALDARWESRIRQHCGVLMVIDDLADRAHDCDILLDQNWFGYSASDRYAGLVAESCIQLLGPANALLRSEYALLRRLMPLRDGTLKRILVFLGGSDPANETRKIALALSDSRLTAIGVDVVLGVNHPDPESINCIAERRAGMAVHQGLQSLAALMVRADLMISGGGATSWERMCLGLPAIVISIADNQTGTNRAMAEAGYVDFAGTSDEVTSQSIADKVAALIAVPEQLREMSKRCLDLVSGQGAATACDTLMTMLAARVHLSQSISAAPQTYAIQILTDAGSWITPYIHQLAEEWRAAGHVVRVDGRIEDAESGDFCFCLSFSRVVPSSFRRRFRHTLVVHESDLPRGRGWAPMTWQILEGCNRIPVTLIEAEDAVDSGVIYAQEWIALDGTELNLEWRKLQALASLRLCREWVRQHEALIASARPQQGEITYYPRRRPEDSRLNPDKTIAEQFELLRVVDNSDYPAFFTYRGRDFLLRIEPKP